MGENRELWALWVSFVDAIVVEMLVEKRSGAGPCPVVGLKLRLWASLQQNKPCFAKPQPEEQLGGILRSTGVGLLFIIYLTLLI